MYRMLRGAMWCCLLLLPLSTQAQAQTKPVVERVEYDMKKLVAPPALSEAELAGRRLFTQRCAFCHEERGRITLDVERVKTAGDASVRERILKGLPRQMPGFQYTLTVAQADQIIAFLKTVKPSPQAAARP